MAFALREDLTVGSDKPMTFQRDGRDITVDGVGVSYAMTYVGGGIGLIW